MPQLGSQYFAEGPLNVEFDVRSRWLNTALQPHNRRLLAVRKEEYQAGLHRCVRLLQLYIIETCHDLTYLPS